MNFSDIIKNSSQPAIYSKGSSLMWTDEYISKQLLKIHLDPDIDLASRKIKTIYNTADWILSRFGDNTINIIDLGCGPGLYTEFYAKRGHCVTGVDFSKNSIEYATKKAERKNLPIHYLHKNYLELDLEENSFDLVTLIYTDFGVLIPEERERLLEIIKRILKPGGIFIFDVLNDTHMENKVTAKDWEIAPSGFWSGTPYIVLSESYLYAESKVVLYQHIVFNETGNVKIYRFWMHLFSDSDIREILSKFNFENINVHTDLFSVEDSWNHDNVLFYTAVNKK